MKRIFIAIPISEKLRQKALEWKNSQDGLLNFPIRWIGGKNLHLTLVPPWRENDIEAAKQKLDSAVGSGALEIEFVKISYGPNLKHRRLIWAEGKPSEKLEELRIHLENIFKVKSENRPWLPHLTVARFNRDDFGRFPVKNLDEKISWKEKIDSVAIMESKLSPSGAEYEILYKINL